METVDALVQDIVSSASDPTLPEGDRLRLVRQFIMDLNRAQPTEQLKMISEAPRASGDRRYDALVAGIVEDFAFHHQLPVPRWTLEKSRFLEQWWFVTSIPAMRPTAFVETPAALANRGVFIRRASLVNV